MPVRDKMEKVLEQDEDVRGVKPAYSSISRGTVNGASGE